jgi:large subunit ribosomal protein L21
MFCIAEIDGFQYKIMENCRIILDNRESLQVNDKVVWNKVLLIASKDFTLLGRPLVANAQVEAIVEEKLKASKVIVF